MDGDDHVRLASARTLHDRLLARDPRGFTLAFELFDRFLVRRLSARPGLRSVDTQIIEDGVSDAIYEYALKPTGFDPAGGRRTLERHLELAAGRNVANRLRADARRRRREQKFAAAHPEAAVELHAPAGNLITDEDAGRLARDRQRLLDLLPDPADRRLLELRLGGERRTTAFAAAMGIGHLPSAQQRDAVKRTKDRIDKVLRRAARSKGRPPS